MRRVFNVLHTPRIGMPYAHVLHSQQSFAHHQQEQEGHINNVAHSGRLEQEEELTTLITGRLEQEDINVDHTGRLEQGGRINNTVHTRLEQERRLKTVLHTQARAGRTLVTVLHTQARAGRTFSTVLSPISPMRELTCLGLLLASRRRINLFKLPPSPGRRE